VAETSGGLVKKSFQLTPEQVLGLEAESERLGLRSTSAVVRLLVQAYLNHTQGTCRQCPIHCSAHEVVQP
jgi:hypothetical protein